MKILEITTNFVPKKITGAEKFCYTFAKDMQKDHKVVIASPIKIKQIETFQNIELKKEHSKYKRKLFGDYYNADNSQIIKQYIKKKSPDIIHIHNTYGLGYNIINTCKKLKPTVITVHDFWPVNFTSTNMKTLGTLFKTPLNIIHKLVLRKILNGTHLVSPSTFLAQELKRTLGNTSVHTIPNGINLTKKKTTLQKKIIFVGRLSKEKGLQIVARELELFVTENPEWSVDILGDGPLLNKLKRKYPRLTFHGFCDPTEFYEKASATIVPSVWPENLPYTILESFNYAVPVIAHSIGSMKNIVNEKNGFLYSNKKELRQILLKLTNKELLTKKSIAAKTESKRYSYNNTIKKYTDLFNSLL